jgi:RNA polymerase sigma factor, sigma-70 family
MRQNPIERLLKDLDSPNPQEAWSEFLSDYSTLIYQVIRQFESDTDNASDCFQFVCEQLIENRSRRLRKFRGEGSATFATWLRAVVRNLCIDWHRKQFGRHRQFRSISRLPVFDQEVFRIIYEHAIPLDESLAILAAQFPNATATRIAESRARIEELLTTNQRWLLANRFKPGNTNGRLGPEDFVPDIEAPQPDPESRVIENQQKQKLNLAIAKLEPNERLLIRLRFEEGLTLDKTAELLGLGNAQRADRQIKDVLIRLRKLMVEDRCSD